MKGTEAMTTTEPPQAISEQTHQPGGLVAPWWHTALMVALIIGLSVAGGRQLRSFGNQPLHLTANYILTIAHEWILAGLAMWGIRMRGVPLRQLLGEQRPGARGWLADIGVAVGYWTVAVCVPDIFRAGLERLYRTHIE